MLLYHYTSVTPAESILHSGLKLSTLTRGDGSIMRGVLWLTSDADFNGHGLLTGKERPTDSEKRYLEEVQGGTLKNEVMADKTAIRIQVDIEDDDPMLHSFVTWSKQNERPVSESAQVFPAYGCWAIARVDWWRWWPLSTRLTSAV